jgi:fumarate hydratase class II
MPGMADDDRIERDSMGEVRVPAAALWRAQTQRAVENFPVSGRTVDPELIAALAAIKAAMATVKAELGMVPVDLAREIGRAADAIAAGEHAAEFPVDVFQTGSGTSTNMNVNEVLATLTGQALERSVHPNDDVNAPLSSNDQFPAATQVAALRLLVHEVVPALAHLAETLERKATETADVVKSGRTHLMDATPVTLGQELGGYAAAVRLGVERLECTYARLGELPLGGTAVGTGVNAPAGFGGRVTALLAHTTGLPLTETRNHFEAQGTRDTLVEVSGQLRTVAISLYKIVNDLRLMASGPATGLAEIRLPDLQPGSSIMPGKVNPVVPESVAQVTAAVIGLDATVAFAGAGGILELNAMQPVMAQSLLEALRLVAAAARLLADRCVAGLEPDRERTRAFAEASPSVVTPLATLLGYDEAAAIFKQAQAEHSSIREVVRARGYVDAGRLTQEQLDDALDVRRMAHPHD